MTDLAAGSSVERIHAPFQPSWMDHLIQWIDRLPGPAWLFYALGMLVSVLLINVTLWIDGSVAFGGYGSIPGIFPPILLYPLALYHYLTRVGSRSLEKFRPLLAADNSLLARVEYELAMLPKWLGWLAVVLGIGGTIPYFLPDSMVFGNLIPLTYLPYVVFFVITAFFIATMFGLIMRSIRQFQMIRRLHAQVQNINLLKLEPAHAFSNLTSRTGVGLILMLIIGAIYNPSLLQTNMIIYGFIVVLLVEAIIFVGPVIGLRDRIIEAKERALNETSDLLKATSDSLHNKVQSGDFTNLAGMETALSALMRERELYAKISTWPWNPGTIRGFASTLLLPLFLWLVTRLLERFF